MQLDAVQFIQKLFHLSHLESQTNGQAFIVRQKSDLLAAAGVKGDLIQTGSQLLKISQEISHFTPNLYNCTQNAVFNNHIKGFSEQNLRQINAFVIDIDTKQHTAQDILLSCIDNSIGAPTLILESPRGFQLFYLLETPYFVLQNKIALYRAKQIARNLKKSLKEINADLFCNDFGFFRMPTKTNTVWYCPTFIYTVDQFIQWSIRQTEELEYPTYKNTTKQKFQYTEQRWFKTLLQTGCTKGDKGMFGRNNTLFTLALACYADKWSIEATIACLIRYNQQLQSPLSKNECQRLIRSAYSGKYTGPNKDYVDALIAIHTNSSATLCTNHWYKHKKDRKDRVRSHLTEWEQDLITFIETKTINNEEEPFIWYSQTEICNTLNMPRSTLNKLLKQSNLILTKTKGKGPKTRTGFTTKNRFTLYLMLRFIKTRKKHANNYAQLLQNIYIQIKEIGQKKVQLQLKNQIKLQIKQYITNKNRQLQNSS